MLATATPSDAPTNAMVTVARVDVAPDQMSATLVLTPPRPAAPPSREQIVQALADVRIPLTQAIEARITEILESQPWQRDPGPIPLVQGTPVVDEIAPQLKLVEAEQVEGASHYERTTFTTVRNGEVVGELIRGPAGQDGVDVFGKTRPHRKAAIGFKIAENVRLDDDGRTLRATADGAVRFRHNILSVQTILEIGGNVDFSTGNIKFGGDIRIKGNVADLFKVHSAGSITVGGAIEAAEVHAEHDLLVTGGIVARDKGICRTGGDLKARFITNASLDVGGNVTAEAEIANCRIRCGGILAVERGPLMASEVTANAGVRCQSLGNASFVRTLVELGIDHHVRLLAMQHLPVIEQKRKQVAKVRTLIEPLMKNLKQLNAQQKERATELLYDADETQAEADALLDEIRKLMALTAERTREELIVQQMIYPGVTIRFVGMETTIRSPIKGPARIAAVVDSSGARRIAIYIGDSHTPHPLEQRPVADDPMLLLRRALAPAA